MAAGALPSAVVALAMVLLVATACSLAWAAALPVCSWVLVLLAVAAWTLALAWTLAWAAATTLAVVLLASTVLVMALPCRWAQVKIPG
jgi:hypothetical protein